MKVFGMLVFLIIMSVNSVMAREQISVSEESGAAYRNGLKFYNEGDYDRAAELFQEACRLDERNVSALFAHGFALKKQEKFGEAVRLFEKVLEKYPGHEKALKLLPITLADAGEDEMALSAYDSGIAAAPDDYYFYLAKAQLLIKLKKFDDAVPLLNKAHEIAPENLKITEILAQTLFELGHIEEAFGYALLLLKKDKNHARARVITGDYKRLKGRLDEALEDYKIAAEDIETKAYAEHFIYFLEHKLEEIEIEREYEAGLAAADSAEGNASVLKAVVGTPETEGKPDGGKTAHRSSRSKSVSRGEQIGSGILALIMMVAVVMVLVVLQAVKSYRKR